MTAFDARVDVVQMDEVAGESVGELEGDLALPAPLLPVGIWMR